jgi:hypothetical protein
LVQEKSRVLAMNARMVLVYRFVVCRFVVFFIVVFF